MKVLVCGGRNYTDREAVNRELDKLDADNIHCIISGGASGADALGELWAQQNGVALMKFPANWNKYGKPAGAIRNGWMLLYGQPDIVLAFRGGTGTADMVNKALAAGVRVVDRRDGVA